jgi:hypothetical protein
MQRHPLTARENGSGLGTATAPTAKKTSCAPETPVRFEVKDNQVRGGLALPHSDPKRVQNNKRPRSAPISGAAQVDGTVSACTIAPVDARRLARVAICSVRFIPFFSSQMARALAARSNIKRRKEPRREA